MGLYKACVKQKMFDGVWYQNNIDSNCTISPSLVYVNDCVRALHLYDRLFCSVFYNASHVHIILTTFFVLPW